MNKIEIPTDKQELQGFLKAIEIAIKIGDQGIQTYGMLTEYQRVAKINLKT